MGEQLLALYFIGTHDLLVKKNLYMYASNIYFFQKREYSNAFKDYFTTIL